MNRDLTPHQQRIIEAIERKVGKIVISIHDEANKYCFKTADGEVKVIDKAFANDAAGLGYVNESKL